MAEAHAWAEVSSKDCESSHGKSKERYDADKELYKSLTITLAESHLVGLSIALDLTALNRHLPGVPPETAYCKCFTDILRHTGEMARRQDGELRDSQFEYVFDSRLETDGTASQIYESFRTLPEWNGMHVFDTKVTFEVGDEPRLEMSDLFAREAMKELDRKLTGIPSRVKRSIACSGSSAFVTRG